MNGNEYASNSVDRHRELVASVIRALKSDVCRNWTLHDMANIALLSKFHFQRVFRRMIGLPPVQFHAALRLAEARRLVLTTDMTCLDICLSLGFNSFGTFTRRFTKLVGASPRSLRRMSRASCAAGGSMAAQGTGIDACGAHSIRVRLERQPGHECSVVIAALFNSAVPQGIPTSAALTYGSDLMLDNVPAGDYNLFCFGVDAPAEPRAFAEADIRSIAHCPVTVTRAMSMTTLTMYLRSCEITDPPCVTALPVLLNCVPNMAEAASEAAA